MIYFNEADDRVSRLLTSIDFPSRAPVQSAAFPLAGPGREAILRSDLPVPGDEVACYYKNN